MLSPEISWFVKQSRPFRGLYMVRFSAVVLTSFLYLADPLILKWLIDDILPWRKEGMLLVAAVGFFLIFLLRLCVSFVSRLIDTYTAHRLMFDIRSRLLRHLQGLSADYFLRTPRGEILHGLEQSVDQICQLGGHTLASLLRISVMTSVTMLILFALNWQLTLLVLPLPPLLLVLRRYSQPRLRDASDRVQRTAAQRSSFLEAHLSTITQVQLLNRTARERRKFVKIAHSAVDATVYREFAELALALSYQVPLMTAGAMVLGFGGLQVLQGKLSIGGLVAFYSYLIRIFDPMETIASITSELQRASAGIRRVMDVFNARPSIRNPENPQRMAERGAMSVDIRDVRLTYDSHQWVLNGFELSIRPGEKVALVGASGGGKSTVARLLTRLYDPDSGSILLDGISIRQIRLKELRSQVALVPQDPVLFDESIKENLLHANPQASDAELHRALVMAQVDSVLDQFPRGWLEPVGPRGDRLSGGQRQRIAVARAILQNPRLLILDEATSALDGLTEHRLLRSLEEFVQDRTVLLIAHRLSAVLWADRVVVLDQGKVLADGAHHELYLRCGLYHGLCDNQMHKEVRADEESDAPKYDILEVVAS